MNVIALLHLETDFFKDNFPASVRLQIGFGSHIDARFHELFVLSE